MKILCKVVLPAVVIVAAGVGVAIAMPTRDVSSTAAGTAAAAGSAYVPITDLGIQPAGMSVSQATTLLNDVQKAGATVVSTAAAWSSLQTSGSSGLDFGVLDQVVSTVRARGLQVRLQLETLPTFARDSTSNKKNYWTPPRTSAELRRWASFAGAVAAHFKGTVKYYEIWNEPNLAEFWPGGVSSTAYARLLQAGYTAIKGADSKAIVISGGLSRNDLGYVTNVYKNLDSLFGQAARTNHHYFDMLGVHPYSGDRSPTTVQAKWVYQTSFGTMDENFTGFTKLHDLMTSEGEGWKKIYIGEFGYSTAASNGFQAVPDATRAGYLTSAFAVVSKYPYVAALSWFYTHPSVAIETIPYALISSDGTQTKTYLALVAHAKATGQVR